MPTHDPIGDISIRFRELADVLEQMPVGVAIAEAPSGKLLFHNAEALVLLRHPMRATEDFQGYTQYGALHADGTPYRPEEYPIARALQGETVPPEEMRYVRGDGTQTFLLVSASPVRDESGEVTRTVSTFLDISERKYAQHALALSQQRLLEALQCGDLLLWDMDVASGAIELIGEARRLLGFDEIALPGDRDSWLMLVHPEDQALFTEALERHIAGATTCVQVEYRIRVHRDGWKWLLTRGRLRASEQDSRLHMAGSHVDITEKKQAELLRKEAEAKLTLAVDIARIGLWEWNVRSNETYFSPHWKRQLGYADHEIANRFEEWEVRVHPEDLPRVMAQIQTCLRRPEAEYQTEFRCRHRDGSYRWIQARAQLIRDEMGRPVRMIGTHLDITDHKDREEHVRHIMQHDRLTALPNRTLLTEQAERWLAVARRSGKRFAVLFIDLDEFKPINDNYGHHIGDMVLREVAVRLKGAFRSHDLIGRLGGDEFVAVITQLDTALGAAHAAVHALHQLSMPYLIGDLQLHTTPSIGISLFPDHGADLATLIRNADAAMYEAKQRGKANYRFFSSGPGGLPEAAELEQLLSEGLAQGRLQLHFQPIVDVGARRLLTAEALLRMPDFKGGVSPDVLIPIAEQNGLITELGSWVLREACDQHYRWRGEGLPSIEIGVNLSAIQFRESGLPAAIEEQISACGIDPRNLWMEISDRAFAGNFEYALSALSSLRALGVRITLDDFGAGYSSLEQLSRLPIERVKIDRSLVTALPADKVSIAVIEAAIAYGNSLGIEVVAEGLESEQVLGFLQERHCHCAQGYYLAPPMPGPQFADWYRHAGLH
jgi:diguanylate cyclase (GGDEF)-like protein/PAS domain S-box-containing protein